jgi:hypothetical protein
MSEREQPELGPIATKVLYEDEQVRIWDQHIAPGEKLGPHRHDNDYVLVDVQGDRIEAETLPGSTSPHQGHFVLEVGRGKTWVVGKGAIEHAWNSGSVAYRSILIEFKQPE